MIKTYSIFSILFMIMVLIPLKNIHATITQSFDITENRASQNILSKPFKLYFEDDLNTLSLILNQNKYAESLELTQKIQEKIQIQHHDIIASYFPKTFKKWKIKKKRRNLENEFGNSDYGIIFTQRYSNPKGHSIEINIVNAEASIKDYQDLIKNPNLLQGMNNTSLVNNNGYTAIETIYEETNHHEHNIILKNNILMTLIAIGIKNKKTLNNFVKTIDMNGLETYLQN
jgi:hypothetical protein